MTTEGQDPATTSRETGLAFERQGAGVQAVPLPVESKLADTSELGDQDGLPRQADVVFVGAGHSALVAAAYLAGAGRSVCLLERMPHPGGWVQTAELGAPGFRHDRYSALHPAFVGGQSWSELAPDLSRHGLDYVTAPLATASSLPDGRTAVAPVDAEAFAVELERLFRVLADRNRLKILNILLRAGGKPVCVCEFTDQLELSQPTVSYHLKQLREAGLLDREKRGTFAYFRVRAEAMERLHSLVEPAALAKAG